MPQLCSILVARVPSAAVTAFYMHVCISSAVFAFMRANASPVSPARVRKLAFYVPACASCIRVLSIRNPTSDLLVATLSPPMRAPEELPVLSLHLLLSIPPLFFSGRVFERKKKIKKFSEVICFFAWPLIKAALKQIDFDAGGVEPLAMGLDETASRLASQPGFH